MRPILSIIIYTNCWVACCVSLLVTGIAHYNQVNGLWLYAFWSFTGTVSAYQTHRLIRLKHLHHTVRSNRRLLWMQNTYYFQWVWLISNSLVFGVLSLLIPLTFQTILLILINALIVGLYVLPLPFLKSGIRSLPFMKNILISCSWTSIVLVPLTSNNANIDWQIIPIIFLSVFAQIIPFDSRDVTYDDKRMRTIPQLFGTTSAKYIGFGLLFVALGCQYSMLHNFGFGLLVALLAIPGHFISFKVGYQLRLEFMWELPLALMGIWFFAT